MKFKNKNHFRFVYTVSLMEIEDAPKTSRLSKATCGFYDICLYATDSLEKCKSFCKRNEIMFAHREIIHREKREKKVVWRIDVTALNYDTTIGGKGNTNPYDVLDDTVLFFNKSLQRVNEHGQRIDK